MKWLNDRALVWAAVVAVIVFTLHGVATCQEKEERAGAIIDEAVMLMESEFSQEQEKGISMLGEIDDVRLLQSYGVIDQLWKVVKNRMYRDRVRSKAIWTLAAIRKKGGRVSNFLAEMNKLLSDTSEQKRVRRAIIEVFVSHESSDKVGLDARRMLNTMENILDSKRESLYVKKSVFKALSQFGISSEKLLSVAMRVLKKPTSPLKKPAINALFNITRKNRDVTDKRVGDIMERIAMEDKETQTRAMSLKVLGYVIRNKNGDAFKDWRECIEKSLSAKEPAVAKAASYAVAVSGLDKSIDKVIDLYKKTDKNDMNIYLLKIFGAYSAKILSEKNVPGSKRKPILEIRDMLALDLADAKVKDDRKYAICYFFDGLGRPYITKDIISAMILNLNTKDEDEQSLYGICLDMLELYTGQNFGSDLKAWVSWWKMESLKWKSEY